MKVKELMIGDLLCYNGKPYRVIQVNSVDGVCGCTFMLENGVEDEGEPIPLTPEILDKNRFIKYDTLSNSKGLWITIYNENYFEGELNYVHELQHAMRLCGIEKEIVL